MNKVNFDKYADNYNSILEDQNLLGQDRNYFTEYKVKIVKERVINKPEKILDYGCGVGRNLIFFKQYFPDAHIYGCDISKESLKKASECEFAKLYHLKNDEIKEKFDLIFIACVFHHIEQELRKGVVLDIYNMLNQNGNVFVFEHNPINPLTKHFVETCPFDADANLLYSKELKNLFTSNGFKVLSYRNTVFVPSYFKRLRFIEKYIGWLPLGGQYFMQFLKL